MKAPLTYIKDRAVATHLIMTEIAPDWTAPGFILPAAFGTLITNLNAQVNSLADKEALLNLATGEWDVALEAWHECSVCVTQVARGAFRGTDKAGAWHLLKANAGSRERITQQGRDIEAAWIAADATWQPKTGLTLASYQALQNTALNKQAAHSSAEKNENLERATLGVNADALYDLSVQWYLMATGAFAAGTIQGDLIRTIPTTYNPNTVPGQLHFTEHFAPAPSQVRLAWTSARAEKFNIYAKAPGAPDFVKILDQVIQTSWMGEGLMAGAWAFKGEGTNPIGTGEPSDVVIVPVAAAAAA